MHFSIVLLATLATSAIAYPQGPGGRGPGFRNGRPNGQNNRNGFQNAPAATTAAAAAPTAAATVAAQDTQPSAVADTPSVIAGNQPTAVPNNDQNGANNNQNGNANGQTGAFDPALVPEFGIQAGQNPDGTGNCIGNNNVKIPCACPPDRQAFLDKVGAAVAAGNTEGVPVSFPTDDSSASAKTRIQTSIVVLQNLNGKGQGCPAASTTFLAQQAAA